MKPRCCLCGRPVLNPAVLIGQLPVGPRCARRAGLIEPTRKRVVLFSPRTRRAHPKPHDENLDLFGEIDA